MYEYKGGMKNRDFRFHLAPSIILETIQHVAVVTTEDVCDLSNGVISNDFASRSRHFSTPSN